MFPMKVLLDIFFVLLKIFINLKLKTMNENSNFVGFNLNVYNEKSEQVVSFDNLTPNQVMAAVALLKPNWEICVKLQN